MVRYAYDKGIRDNVFLATKVGVDWKQSAIITRDRVRESLETSLKELQTSYVDCIQIHKGMDTMLSQTNLHWRELVLTRARELGMGVLAMKVLGSFAFGHNAPNIVPDFGEDRLRHLHG